MRFIPVDELPVQKKHTSKKNHGDHIREFLNMKVKYAKLDISDMDYITPYSACTSIKHTIKYHGLPVDVKFINAEVYLVNLEMEDE